MPKHGKRGTSSHVLPTDDQDMASGRDSSPRSSPSPPPPQSDLCALIRWMKDREDVARAQREEEEIAARAEREQQRRDDWARFDEQRREDAARFEALLTRLTFAAPPHTGPPPSAAGAPVSAGLPAASSTPSAAPSAPKAAIQPPPPLSPDVTFQNFREWRRRWEDYATMVDLASLPRPKQLIQLRMCLTLGTQRVLEHTLHVPPDSAASVEDVLDLLQKHVKDSSNEALRRRAFTSCKQAVNESFADFFVRLKGLSEEIDVCKAQDVHC